MSSCSKTILLFVYTGVSRFCGITANLECADAFGFFSVEYAICVSMHCDIAATRECVDEVSDSWLKIITVLFPVIVF